MIFNFTVLFFMFFVSSSSFERGSTCVGEEGVEKDDERGPDKLRSHRLAYLPAMSSWDHWEGTKERVRVEGMRTRAKEDIARTTQWATHLSFVSVRITLRVVVVNVVTRFTVEETHFDS